jgi:hypothetical protein
MADHQPSPFEQVLQLIFGNWISSAVCVLARLGVPDHIHEEPRSAEEIAPLVAARPDLLYRLMRATSGVGVLHETNDKKFVHTPLSRALRSDASPCLRDVAKFNTDEWHERGWEGLERLIKTGERPMQHLYKREHLFEYFREHPDEGATFHNGMTNLSSMEAPLIAHGYDFSGIHHLMDVGGGHGLLLATILERFPKMKGTLYETPPVIAGASGGPLEKVKDRVTLTAGDMFQSVPAGADAYMMKYIIHDWPDDLCYKILKSCRAGVNGAGGKLIVVDTVVPGPNEFHFGKIMDLEMALFPGGKERTEVEFKKLFEETGWKLSRVIRTPAHISILEGIPA